MISAIVQGELIADPVARTTAAGATFATASVRVPAGAEAALIGLGTFSATAAEKLLQLRKGDSLAAVGVLETNVWKGRDGEERKGWRLTASQILTTYEAGKRRKAAAGKAEGGDDADL